MRISLADSRRNGFKRWSDAQCPTGRTLPAHPEGHKQQADLTRSDEDISKAPK